MNFSAETGDLQRKTALVVFTGMAAAILAVQGFEHIGGYIPCKLCLEQRQPYYAGMPLMLVAAVSAWRGWPATVTRGLLIIGGLLMLYTASVGVYQSGAEWDWWPGPTDCGAVAGGDVTNAGDLLSQLVEKKAPSCDVAAGRFLGLSFAGWNVLAGLGIAAIAFLGGFGKANAKS